MEKVWPCAMGQTALSLYPREFHVCDLDGTARFDFGPGAEAFCDAVGMLWAKAEPGVRLVNATLYVGGARFASTRPRLEHQYRDEVWLWRLDFCAISDPLPLNLLSRAHVEISVAAEPEALHLEFLYLPREFCAGDPLLPDIHVVTDRADHGALEHNRWVFSGGTAQPKFLEGFESEAELHEAERCHARRQSTSMK